MERDAAPVEMVRVAVAAERLTATGDRIDASNVSRYLARFRDIPQQRSGKYRFVDLVALMKHRRENVLVGEKRAARGVEPKSNAPAPPPPKIVSSPVDFDALTADPMTPIGQANLELRRIQIRNAQIDLDEREGRLVAATEVLAVVSTVMQAFVDALIRQEADVTQRLGRETGIEFRKMRKAAQAVASGRLTELAQKHLPKLMVQTVMPPIDGEPTNGGV